MNVGVYHKQHCQCIFLFSFIKAGLFDDCCLFLKPTLWDKCWAILWMACMVPVFQDNGRLWRHTYTVRLFLARGSYLWQGKKIVITVNDLTGLVDQLGSSQCCKATFVLRKMYILKGQLCKFTYTFLYKYNINTSDRSCALSKAVVSFDIVLT